MQKLREESLQVLKTQRMPSTRNEEYRYTDISSLLQTSPKVLPRLWCMTCVQSWFADLLSWFVEEHLLSQAAEGGIKEAELEGHRLSDEGPGLRLVIVNGKLDQRLSVLKDLPPKAFVGALADAPESTSKLLVSSA